MARTTLRICTPKHSISRVISLLLDFMLLLWPCTTPFGQPSMLFQVANDAGFLQAFALRFRPSIDKKSDTFLAASHPTFFSFYLQAFPSSGMNTIAMVVLHATKSLHKIISHRKAAILEHLASHSPSRRGLSSPSLPLRAFLRMRAEILD